MENKNKPWSDKDKNYWMSFSLKVFAESTGWIAVPVVGALYLGRYLDAKQNTGSLYFFGLTALAFVISCIGLARIGIKYMAMLDSGKEEKKDHESNK
ncbi:MAG: hypothetical protein QG603_316 [Patescibacteria group bacterium]|nr:hypothetical protein [Patescibacteria group bacterium]